MDHFATPGYDKLELRTRSANVMGLLGLDHGGNTILSFGLNPDQVVKQFELGTASLDERLQAARACQEAGYPVRFRLDPLVAIDGWEEQYSQMIERALPTVVPEQVTLGSYHLLGNLSRVIAERFPESPLLGPKLERDGEGLRYPHELRRRLYEFVTAEIRRLNESVPISVCKETPRMWSELGTMIARGECSCHPQLA